MVQSDSKPLPGPQEMFFDHLVPPERISELFSKIEISTSKSIFHASYIQSQDYVIPIQFFVELHLSKSTWMNCDIWKKFRNLFWGSGKWFGTTLDHLGCITSHFTENNFWLFFDFFKLFSKDFCLFLKDLSCTSRKNSIFFSKISLVWKIRSLKS